MKSRGSQKSDFLPVPSRFVSPLVSIRSAEPSLGLILTGMYDESRSLSAIPSLPAIFSTPPWDKMNGVGVLSNGG